MEYAKIPVENHIQPETAQTISYYEEFWAIVHGAGYLLIEEFFSTKEAAITAYEENFPLEEDRINHTQPRAEMRTINMYTACMRSMSNQYEDRHFL